MLAHRFRSVTFSARAAALVGSVSVLALVLLGNALAENHGQLGLPPRVQGAGRGEDVIGLGRRLFFDPRLSASGETSCASCHDPAVAFSGRVTVDSFRRVVGRKSPSLVNVAFAPILTWDGRFLTLEEQALQPIIDPNEMNSSVEAVLRVLERDSMYVRQFRAAFGAAPNKQRMLTALAEYQRSLIAGNSPFDRYLFGGDEAAVSAEVKRGYRVFLKANCIQCHELFHESVHPLGGGEALFTDFAFHNLGVGFRDGAMSDVGRYQVTAELGDWGAFKTPTLRNASLTAPYMHDGSLLSLKDVVVFYNNGGIPNPGLDPAIEPLHLSNVEMDELVAFLESLTSSPETWQTPSRAKPGRGFLKAGLKKVTVIGRR